MAWFERSATVVIMWHRGGDQRDLHARAMAAVDTAARASGFTLEASQRAAAGRLALLAGELAGEAGSRVLHRRRDVRGVYLWGPPGRGKSWLADTWYAALPPGTAYRVHFHDFFRRLQDSIFGRRGQSRAIDAAMAELVGNARVVCFDEFHVHDPGDAMLVTRLLRELLDRHVALVATSNYAPRALLPNPLFHHLFEPAIGLIEEHLDVVEVSGPRDYRTVAASTAADGSEVVGSGFRAGAIVSPADASTFAELGLPAPDGSDAVVLAIGRRTLTARAARDGILWIDYAQLCETATGTADYLALAERFDTWVVDNIPAWLACSSDSRQRLASVVDVAYDRDIRLYLAGPDNPGRPPANATTPADYARTASRLSQLRSAPATREPLTRAAGS